MLPIQFITLLLLASVAVESAAETSAPATTAPPAAFPLLLLGSLYFSQLLLASFIWTRARAAIRAMHEPAAAALSISQRTDTLFNRARWLTLVITAVHLFSSSLPNAFDAWLRQTVIFQHIPLLPEITFILPASLAWLVFWTASYFIEAAARERGMPYRLARQTPVHEMPALGEFLSMQVRHNFFPLVFLVFLKAIELLGHALTPWLPNSDVIASITGMILLLLVLPWMLVRFWTTSPLEGALRERLDRVASLHRLRFRNILLWKTHNMVTNAAILGWVPFARYFLMTDSLVESFSDRQLEAVFAHEVGHGVHRHIPWYFVTFLSAWLLATPAAVLVLKFIPASPQLLGNDGMTLSLLLTIALFGATFSFVSARFEHQADWFACRHMGRMIEERRETVGILPAGALMTQVDPLPPELKWSLSTLPTTAETVSLEEYMAGHYPHATEHQADPAITESASLERQRAGDLASPPPTIPSTSVSSPLPELLRIVPLQLGTEIFISALDTIVESSHRSRERRDLMHPSINNRIRLLRELASSPEAVSRFNRAMLRTRLLVAALGIIGLAATAATVHLWPSAQSGANGAATAPESVNDANPGR